MNLRKKALLFFTIFILIWIITMQYIIPIFIMKSFNTIEQHSFEEKMTRVEIALNKTLSKHDMLLLDWASWTTAYDFVENPNSKFLDDNLDDSFFIDQKIHFLIMYDSNNELINASGFDFDLNISQKVPELLIETLKEYDNQNGLLYVDQKAYIFSKSNVSNSDNSKTSNGSFAFVSELTHGEIGRLSENMQENIYLINQYELGKTSEITKTLYNTDATRYVIYKLPYDNIKAHMKLKLILPKDITKLGEQSLHETLFVFTISASILCILMYLILRHIVIRIMRLNNDVIKIRNNEDIGLRVNTSGKDELRTLQENINIMLDHIDAMNKELNNHATYDLMTGVLNRRSGFDKLKYNMHISKENKTPLTITFIDINNLKYVNDTYGHGEGDEYIKNICIAIKKNIRETDILFRLGGDEFLIVFVNSKYNTSKNTTERIKLDINSMISETDIPYEMSISCGIVEYDFEYDINNFIELADKEMYKDKKIFKFLNNN